MDIPYVCTLTLCLGVFEQSKLGWVVHQGELVEQGLDHLSYPGLGADVQVSGRVLGQVEGRPPAPPAALRSLAPVRRKRDRTGQVEMDLDETCVRPVFILKVTQLDVKENAPQR